MGQVQSIARGARSLIEFQRAAKRGKQAVPVFVVTLDALGTLYKFRRPLSIQYQQVAESCGLKGVDPKLLDRSFQSAYKLYNSKFPNYGKGSLTSPEEWWTMVINASFGQVVSEDRIPKSLASELYGHFSTADAYELCPDARVFLQTMRALRNQHLAPDGPLLSLGVVTNSDPRVSSVLHAMGIEMGRAKPSKLNFPPFARVGDSLQTVAPPWSGFWDQKNDFDFIVTSYDAGSAKPDGGIWEYASGIVPGIVPARGLGPHEPAKSTLDVNSSTMAERDAFWNNHLAVLTPSVKLRVGEVKWLHIGDEYRKDYEGARKAGFEALHLDRSGKHTLDDSVQTISSLEEAAMIVNLMAREHFEAS